MSDRDRAMIENPDDWPVWPYLPMKAPGWKVGFFFCPSFTNNKVVFYEGNMLAKDATKTALTVDEVLAAGWRVD